MSEKKLFLKNIHYFRAFAIINIVLVHVWTIPERYKESHHTTYTFITTAREVLFHDSTIYFIFISGFLFYYLSSKFELRRYYKNKVANVISPYIVMTSLILILKINEYIRPEYSWLFSLKKILTVFIYGKAQVQYWYIPFIALVFIISPFLLKIPKDIFSRIVFIASILPLFGTRTATELSFWQYIYFFPVYLQGMYVAMDYSNIILKIDRNKIYLILIAIISSTFVTISYWNSYYISSPKLTESVFYIQKLSITFLIILAFQKLENKNIPILNNFATYSFAIYFTHILVGYNSVRTYYYHFFTESSFLILPASILYAVIITFTTLFICMGVKKLLGKQSRYFIGA
ncbi:MAG: acyltransferase [Proteobacteria bacterium]|nr:acyltransferase [Pseudomonadota bacterium]MBU1138741.1 acyltransferase [Pseudomonadota bacterium]